MAPWGHVNIWWTRPGPPARHIWRGAICNRHNEHNSARNEIFSQAPSDFVDVDLHKIHVCVNGFVVGVVAVVNVIVEPSGPCHGC